MISELEEKDQRKKKYIDFKFITEHDLRPYFTYKFEIMDTNIVFV
jgi:hypothetical protein